MKIVGIGYKKNSGKNTFAKFLSTYIRCESPKTLVKEISFAAKLKDITWQLYGWCGLERGIYYETHRHEKELILPRIGKSPRQLWIEIGNKLREVYDYTWIDYALQGVKADILIISDLRFRNEALAINHSQGQLIRIDRDGLVQGTDPAEIDLDGWTAWDYIIKNNGSFQDLNAEAERIARELL